MNFLLVLRRRHLAILWVSQVLSAMGDYLYEIAVLWIAVKQVGGGAGLVAAAESGSMLVFGLLGGVYADRWNRRTTMIAVDILQALAVAILPILAFTGTLQLWHLVVIAVIVGGLGAFFDPALQASLPILADNTQLLQATNGLMDVTRRLARILGPSMAGILIALMPLAHFFTLDAISFAISAVAIFSLGRHFAWEPMLDQQSKPGIGGIFSEITDALRLVRKHKPLAWAIMINGTISIVWSAAFIVGVPLLADRVLGGSVAAYGLIVGAYGVGNVLSNIAVGNMKIRHRVATIFVGKVLLGIGFVVIAFSHVLWMALLGSAFAAIGGPMGDIMSLLMIQTDLPSNQVGKVYSLRMILESAGSSLGLVLAAPLFAFLSITTAIAVCALLMMAMGFAGLLRFGVTEPALPQLDLRPFEGNS